MIRQMPFQKTMKNQAAQRYFALKSKRKFHITIVAAAAKNLPSLQPSQDLTLERTFFTTK